MSLKTLKFLKNLNIVTSVVIALLAFYIIMLPYFPDITSASIYINRFEVDNSQLKTTLIEPGTKVGELHSTPKDNRLVIPKIYVNAPIGESRDRDALGQGMLRLPNTSTPDIGGNTVIIGHRVLFTSGPLTLYYLDQVRIDDLILVYWKGTEYAYKVYEVKVVSPDQIEIEDNTKESIITLYTCTPKWTSQRRLVVRAILQ